MSEQPSIRSKGRYLLKYRGNTCLNCGHPLDISDKYCPNCSQANSTKKLSMRDFFDEFFSNLFNTDSRLFTTLNALFTKPGRITRDYTGGKRLMYTNPFKLLLSLAILFFLMITYKGEYQDMDRWGARNADRLVRMDSPFNFSMISDPEDSTNGSVKVSRERPFMVRRDSIIRTDPLAYINSLNDSSFIERLAYKQDLFMRLVQGDSVLNLEDIHQKYGIEKNLENNAAFGMARSFLRAMRTPGSFIISLISNLPLATFFFFPVFTVFIWLVYIRKKYTYTDNLIFSFHNQSLLFILLIISFLVDLILDIESTLVFMLIFAIYLYKAMRNFYKQGRIKTILKYLFLNTIFFILASVGVFLFIIGGVLTY